MGDFEDGRNMGLWGDDGILHSLNLEDADHNDDEDIWFKEFEYHKEDFPGMRDTGSVLNKSKYSISEYENKGYRLEEIALEIQNSVNYHFVLYDYKGSIQTNDLSVLNILKNKYGDEVEVDSDVLFISDSIINVNPRSDDYISVKNNNGKPLKVPDSINIKNAKPSFGVLAIAKTLASIITNIPDKTGMMVGIFGKWGRGKTYLVDNIFNEIDEKGLTYKRVVFSAWKYQETKESWAYLYESMINSYLNEGKKGRVIPDFLNRNVRLFKLNFHKNFWFPIFTFIVAVSFSIYWSFLGGSFDVIKLLLSSFGVVTLIKVFLFYLSHKSTAIGLLNTYFSKKSYSNYLGLQAEVESELEVLIKTWIPNPDSDEKIILFVDDIDRCEASKVIKLIDGLRIILDNEEIHKRLIIITAVDEYVLKQSIINKFNLDSNSESERIYHEYLEKIFIIGLKLNALNDYEVEEYISKLLPEGNNESINVHNIDGSLDDVNNNSTLKSKGNIKAESTSINLDDNDYDLSESEKVELIKATKELSNPTPRKVKIFYYKYLMLKKIFHVRLEEKGLAEKWDSNADEKLILDILTYVSNREPISMYQPVNIKMDPLVFKELKYSVEMLSVL